LADALQGGQRSLAEAGQDQQGAQGQSGWRESGSQPGAFGDPQNRGGGMGQAGIGDGGHSGPQRPLDGSRRDSLVRGNPDPKGPQSSRSYKDQPDMNPSRAPAYTASPEFRRKTEAAMRREEIPASYRRQVKEYFDSIRQR
jgi:hypothetical protein